jgi:hypothetical protein
MVGGMDRQLSRRGGEDQPAVACVHGGKFEDITEKGPDFVGVFRVNERMDSVDHAENLPLIHTDAVGFDTFCPLIFFRFALTCAGLEEAGSSQQSAVSPR